MKNLRKTAKNRIVALALASTFVLGAATVSLAKDEAKCVQEYDTSGAPIAPYCKDRLVR